MIRHLFKLVWNRKRASLLLVAEIFISFLVLLAVLTLGVYSLDNYRRPLGFSIQDVWDVGIDMKLTTDDTWDERMTTGLAQLLQETRSLPDVEFVAGAHSTPYELGGSASSWVVNGRNVQFDFAEVTDDFARVLGLTLREGRFFGAEDDAADFRPVVVDETFAKSAFGDTSAIGKLLSEAADGRPESRVIGVVASFRKGGELSGPGNFAFFRTVVGNKDHRPGRHLLVKVRPGTPRAFEETLLTRLQRVVPDWSFTVKTLGEARASSLRLRTAPIVVTGIVALFLLGMVALGLTGVLWQNVTQRTREIGLRRAKGASARAVLAQILGELLVLTSFGLILGLAVAVQLPLLGLTGWVGRGVYATSLSLSTLLILLLTTACGLYPGWLATRIPPAEALRYE